MASGNKLFGKRIKELREKKRYTQEKLAEVLGLDYQTISRIETGYYFTSYDNLEKLATALDVEVKDLFQTKHLEEDSEITTQIIKILENASSEEKRLIFKVITSILR